MQLELKGLGEPVATFMQFVGKVLQFGL